MTIKAFFNSTGRGFLKVLRALWRAIGALMAGFVWALVECMKHASAADDDSDEDKPYGHEVAEYHVGAAEHHFDDGWGS